MKILICNAYDNPPHAHLARSPATIDINDWDHTQVKVCESWYITVVRVAHTVSLLKHAVSDGLG